MYRGTPRPSGISLTWRRISPCTPSWWPGPIVRYADVAPQLRSRTHTVQDAALGARRFALGLGKKVLLANVLYELVTVYQQSGQKTVLLTWMYAAAYMMHVYFDFSGYSDMAIGLGRIMGFRFAENFRYPFVSGSLTEFWRRWHISLGSWFRDYVYIPLGGSRVRLGRWVLNLLVVWGLTGLWHGAAWTFVLWGLYFAVFLLLEKLFLGRLLRRLPVLRHVYVLAAALFSFVLFDASSLPAAIGAAGAMLGLGHLPIMGQRRPLLSAQLCPGAAGSCRGVHAAACRPVPPDCRRTGRAGAGRAGACGVAGPAGACARRSWSAALPAPSCISGSEEVHMKTKQIITVCLLAGFLAGFGLWSVLRTPDAVSQAERRPSGPAAGVHRGGLSVRQVLPMLWTISPPTSSLCGAASGPCALWCPMT